MNFFKRPRSERKNHETIMGGRRAGENDNPYLAARRTWNDHTASVVASRNMWQVLGILSLMIALSSIGGAVYIGSQSKFVPYVIEVDKLGQALAVTQAMRSSAVDPRVIKAAVASFISDSRLVSPDVALQRQAVFRLYAMLRPHDPATEKANQWLNGTEDSTPFKRAAKEMVSIEIASVIPMNDTSWKVDWVETVRDRQGVVKDQPFNMQAVVTTGIEPPTPETTEEQLRKNPLGIYIRDFSWSKQL